ncbi:MULTISPECIES: hypothetical protein [unclassified Mycolicibacterium]|uniref:hypothetical protein n=1 Tax=unclassified Mycolicibacterium TaxID=2636767 RepID=UPI002ED7BD60
MNSSADPQYWIYRLNPLYEFIQAEALAVAPVRGYEVAVVQFIGDCPALLLPRSSQGTVKGLYSQSASLCQALQSSRRLIDALPQTGIREVLSQVATLVSDQILEVWLEGAFRSGPAAAARVYPVIRRTSQGPLAALSYEAVKYAQNLDSDDASLLSRRMYLYNRHPMTPAWARAYEACGSTIEFLGLCQPAITRALDQRFRLTSGHQPDSHWLIWRRTDAVAASISPVAAKLYVNIDSRDLRACASDAVTALGESRAKAFKLGNSAHGLVRSDKLVAYFTCFDDLLQAADDVRRRLHGCGVQGTPFTAAITSDGLMSWGIDALEKQTEFAESHGRSWRLWVTNCLAIALCTSRNPATAPAQPPWELALDRLTREGIDTATWLPKEALDEMHASTR